MSIKTSKRIALGVIASLVFAPFAAIAPASANITAVTVSSTVTNTGNTGTAALPIPSGTALTADLTIATTGNSAAGNSVTPTFTVTAGPASLNITSTCTFTASAAIAADWTVNLTNAATGAFTVVAVGVEPAATYTIGTVSCPTTIGGSYTITPTGTAAGAAAVTPTHTAVTANVSGLNVSQGLTRSTTAGTAATGGAATVIFTAPTRAAAGQIFTVASSGVGSITSVADGANATITRVNGSTADYSAGARIVSTANDTTTLISASIVLSSSVAGVQTISTFSTDATTGVQTLFRTATVTWGEQPSISAGSSTAFMAGPAETTAANFTATSNAIARSAPRAAGTAIATIYVNLVDSDGAADARANTVRATVTSGVGFVDVNGTAASLTNSSQRIDSNTETDATRFVRIYSDGIAGAGEVTVTVTDVRTLAVTTLGVFKYESTGAQASIAVSTTRYTIGRAGFTTGGATVDNSTLPASATVADSLPNTANPITTPAFVVVVKDSGGRVMTASQTPTVESDNPLVSSGGSCALDNGVNTTHRSSTNGIGYYNCNFSTVPTAVSGSKATLTISIPDPASTTGGKLTTTYAISVGGAPATEKLEFNKATYEQGEGMTITRSAVDASGNPVYDGALAPAVTFNKAIGGTAPGAALYIGGRTVSDNALGAKTVFAPVAFGSFTASMTGRTAAALSTITATASVPAPVVPVVEAPAEKPTLAATVSGARLFLSGTAVEGEGDIIIYVKRVGTTAWKERAKTLEVAAPGDFNGSIKAPRGNVVIRVKQEGTGQFSNQVLVLR